MNSKILLPLTLCVIFSASSYSAAAHLLNSPVIPSYECEGNACSVVDLTWDNERQQFRVKNDSNRSVKVEVSTFAGTSSIAVPPNDVNFLEVKTFNGPYRANYE
jgi:hypothetical protein